jgi:hypothetical protein
MENAPLSVPVRLLALCAPKEGNSTEQYEDAYAYTLLAGNNASDPPDFREAKYPVRVALADGASSAVFAREWAELLVTTFAEHGFPPTDTEAAQTIAALGHTWRARTEGKATAWWAQEKMTTGSAATLLVVTWDREHLLWEAVSVGDVCVFLVRNNRLRYGFPLTRSAGFSDRPELISTEIGSRATLPPVVRYVEQYQEGDRFLLMTDALSHYFLSQFEKRQRPWNRLPQSTEELHRWLHIERDSGALKNDDVTLIDIIL